MRRSGERLADIVDALTSVARMIEGISRDQFVEDERICYAVAQRLTVVGEAAARLDSGFRDSHPEVPWPDIIAFRNVLVHEYFGIHWPLVWTTATEHAPQLKEQITAILQAKFPASGEKGATKANA